MSDLYLTTQEVMTQTKFSRATIDRYAASGALSSYRPGGTGPRRFKQSDLDRFMERSGGDDDDEKNQENDLDLRSIAG
jgi:excisionase family DNA binding protein